MFVQIINFRTSQYEAGRELVQEFQARTEGRRTVRRAVMCRDRDDPTNMFNVVFFDSYESAMQNSQLPVTQEFSQRMMALGDGPPTFYNLDVLQDIG